MVGESRIQVTDSPDEEYALLFTTLFLLQCLFLAMGHRNLGP
jgi:hypothetical protein